MPSEFETRTKENPYEGSWKGLYIRANQLMSVGFMDLRIPLAEKIIKIKVQRKCTLKIRYDSFRRIYRVTNKSERFFQSGFDIQMNHATSTKFSMLLKDVIGKSF